LECTEITVTFLSLFKIVANSSFSRYLINQRVCKKLVNLPHKPCDSTNQTEFRHQLKGNDFYGVFTIHTLNTDYDSSGYTGRQLTTSNCLHWIIYSLFCTVIFITLLITKYYFTWLDFHNSAHKVKHVGTA